MSYKITRVFNTYTTKETPYDVYEYIVEHIFREDARECCYQAHKEAEAAQSWCEMADVGDVYDGGDFTIECLLC